MNFAIWLDNVFRTCCCFTLLYSATSGQNATGYPLINLKAHIFEDVRLTGLMCMRVPPYIFHIHFKPLERPSGEVDMCKSTAGVFPDN